MTCLKWMQPDKDVSLPLPCESTQGGHEAFVVQSSLVPHPQVWQSTGCGDPTPAELHAHVCKSFHYISVSMYLCAMCILQSKEQEDKSNTHLTAYLWQWKPQSKDVNLSAASDSNMDY